MIGEIKEHAWSWVGKAAALLGLILLGFQLADQIRQPEYKATAVAVTYPMVVPGAFDRAVRSLVSSVRRDTVQTSIFRGDSAMVHDFLRQEQVVLVTVANQGQRELSKIVLEVPDSGYYSSFPGRSIEQVRSEFEGSRLERPSQTVSRFGSEIAVGSLRPASQVTFVLWTTRRLWFIPEQYRVTHPYGAIQVDFTDYGRDWYDYPYLMMLVPLLLAVPFLFWGIRSEQRQRERTERMEANLKKLVDTISSES